MMNNGAGRVVSHAFLVSIIDPDGKLVEDRFVLDNNKVFLGLSPRFTRWKVLDACILPPPLLL